MCTKHDSPCVQQVYYPVLERLSKLRWRGSAQLVTEEAEKHAGSATAGAHKSARMLRRARSSHAHMSESADDANKSASAREGAEALEHEEEEEAEEARKAQEVIDKRTFIMRSALATLYTAWALMVWIIFVYGTQSAHCIHLSSACGKCALDTVYHRYFLRLRAVL